MFDISPGNRYNFNAEIINGDDLMVYRIHVAGLDRDLPICSLNENLSIAAFVIFGDVELTCACAGELLKKAPDFDYMIAPEPKALPLIHAMARQSGRND